MIPCNTIPTARNLISFNRTKSNNTTQTTGPHGRACRRGSPTIWVVLSVFLSCDVPFGGFATSSSEQRQDEAEPGTERAEGTATSSPLSTLLYPTSLRLAGFLAGQRGLGCVWLEGKVLTRASSPEP